MHSSLLGILETYVKMYIAKCQWLKTDHKLEMKNFASGRVKTKIAGKVVKIFTFRLLVTYL